MTLDDELLILCADAIDAQHRALDRLLAHVMRRDPDFLPSKSDAWPAVIMGQLVLQRLRRLSELTP